MCIRDRLKGVENGRFIFFTNYESIKGRQLTANPYISLSFVWHKLERQIHIEGKAERCAPAAVSYTNLMQVVADVDEADIGGVEEGQRATFTVDAYPCLLYTSTLITLALSP